MTSDDQHFIDWLSSIPSTYIPPEYLERGYKGWKTVQDGVVTGAVYVKDGAEYLKDAGVNAYKEHGGGEYAEGAAGFIDRTIDSAACSVRQMLGLSAAGAATNARRPLPPRTFFQKTSDWISENRTVVAVAVAFTGTTIFLVYRRRRDVRRKRRARRTQTGAKKEVVVLATTVHDPLSRSLAFDLERRGYIVYVTVSSRAEHDLIESGSDARSDVRPLWMDMTSSVPNPEKDMHPNLAPIYELISKPQIHQRGPGFQDHPYMCTLAGVILMPATDHERTPLSSVTTHDLIDAVNTRLLGPMLVARQFLPLLTTVTQPTSVIVAYPSITSSLTPPLQAALAATTSALSSFTRSLRSELLLLQPPTAQPIQVTELKMGNLDLGTTPAHSKSQNAAALEAAHSNSPSPSRPSAPQQALPWHWHSSQRAEVLRRTFGQTSSSVRGSPIRAFHNAVFDTLYAAHYLKPTSEQTWGSWITGLPVAISSRGPGGVVYAGRGAWIYDTLSSSSLIPRSLIDHLVRWRSQRDGWTAGSVDLEKGDSQSPRSRNSSPSMEGMVGIESAVWEKV